MGDEGRQEGHGIVLLGCLHLEYFRGENCRRALCLGSPETSTKWPCGQGDLAGPRPEKKKKGQSLDPSLKHLSRLMALAGLVRLREPVALELVLDCHLLMSAMSGEACCLPPPCSPVNPILITHVHVLRKVASARMFL